MEAARLLREWHEVKTPQERGTSDEEAEAMPVESEPAVAEIHFHKVRLTIKGKSTRMFSFHTLGAYRIR